MVVSAFLLLLALAASNQGLKHSDEKYKVDTAMTQNNLGVVKVSQYQDKGVIPVTGDVESEDQKAEATDVAAQPAPGYAISNELGVRPVGQEGQAKRDEAQKLAKARPNVKEVINKIQGR